MSSDFIFRLIGMVGFAIGGLFWGRSLGEAANVVPGANTMTVEQYTFSFGLVGALVGLLLTPYISTKPVRGLRKVLTQATAQNLVAALAGLIVGLIVAVLLSFPLSLLPDPMGSILPFIAVILFGYLGVSIFVMRSAEIFSVFPGLQKGQSIAKDSSGSYGDSRTILLDTSVIIDGRIADVTRTGFIQGSLLIPRFVLNELQYIADSSDSMRRQRGRRGMEVLAALQKEPTIPIRISDIDVDGVREVDDKLVVLARQMRCPILTNDYNLNRIAELQGVTILNINELANAVKSILLPGEIMQVKVIQEGRESGQGVAYMDDGTMVVVESGKDYMDKDITVMVTKVLQTAAGRMIFARPEEGPGSGH